MSAEMKTFQLCLKVQTHGLPIEVNGKAFELNRELTLVLSPGMNDRRLNDLLNEAVRAISQTVDLLRINDAGVMNITTMVQP